MRVALVSTYPPAQCGIGNYACELRAALATVASGVAVAVLAERLAGHDESDPAVTRCWSRRGNWHEELVDAIARAGVDVIHVQHEESIFGQGARFLDFLARVQRLGVRVVVTLHTVYDRVMPVPFRVPGRSFHRKLARTCDAIVVHQRGGMADVLAQHGVVTDRIAVIPHGTPTMKLPDRHAARAVLGIPEGAPTALFFGFIHRTKNLHVVVRAFERVCIDLPDARLVIAGRIRRNNAADEWYAAKLSGLVRPGIEAGRILYHAGFVPPERKATYFAAADLLLLPHAQRYGSASGVLHEGLAAGRAIMCSRGKKFAELVEELSDATPFAVVPPRDVDAWEIGMERLLASSVDRHRVVRHVERLARETSWHASARRHADVYDAIRGAAADMARVG